MKGDFDGQWCTPLILVFRRQRQENLLSLRGRGNNSLAIRLQEKQQISDFLIGKMQIISIYFFGNNLFEMTCNLLKGKFSFQ